MVSPGAVVVTTVHAPGPAMLALAEGCRERGLDLVVAGDTGGPSPYPLPGCRYLPPDGPDLAGFALAGLCPEKNYARKNLGYLAAMARHPAYLLDTDDDNHPYPAFFDPPEPTAAVPVVQAGGWVNVYRYFSDSAAWPRGFPPDLAGAPPPDLASLPCLEVAVPIRQGLADGCPDVDALYRLTHPGVTEFGPGRVALGPGTWCPINSQNTAWLPEAFPLLYLPSHCSFRMSDIWRGLIAQRIAWENGWHVLHREATVRHDRNPHDLRRDFLQELPGLAANKALARILEETALAPGPAAVPDNLRRCYEVLIGRGFFPAAERPLVSAWLSDAAGLGFGG